MVGGTNLPPTYSETWLIRTPKGTCHSTCFIQVSVLRGTSLWKKSHRSTHLLSTWRLHRHFFKETLFNFLSVTLTCSRSLIYYSLKLNLPICLKYDNGIHDFTLHWTLDRRFERFFAVSSRFSLVRYSVIDS